jgi:hypothetical protein
VYSLEQVEDLEVGTYRTSQGAVLLRLKRRYADGRKDEVTIDIAWLDHGLEEIAEHIRKVWMMVRGRELTKPQDKRH